MQLEVAPPLLPLQLHVHGPVPLTAVALPDEHRFVLGAVDVLPPLAEPHTPSTRTGAEQPAVVPPNAPVQLQLHGPVPVTDVAVPAEHRFVLGADVTPTPLADPQDPFTVALHTVLLRDHVPSPVPEHVAVADPWKPPALFVSDCVWLRVAVVVVALQLPQVWVLPAHDL